MPGVKMLKLEDFDYKGKRVLLRVDINSPLDLVSRKIVNRIRLEMSIPTIKYLHESGARLTIIAHQGDIEDYHKLISLEEHASQLTYLLGEKVMFIDDVAGPAAREKIGSLKEGDILLLDNLRYLCEEVSSFERDTKLTPAEMTTCYLVRNLSSLFDYYVNDAFAAAHRKAPSMVAFQELLPSAAGKLLIREVEALTAVVSSPRKPCIFLLGGLRAGDAFGMMRQALRSGTADRILTGGITGQIMLMAKGVKLGEASERFIKDRSLDRFLPDAVDYLSNYPAKVTVPEDVAVNREGKREEFSVPDLPVNGLINDVGKNTVKEYEKFIEEAGTIFVNGPPGVYEEEVSAEGTRNLWNAVAEAAGYSVMGGGDTISAASRFIDMKKIDYVCTAGGALIRFLSGVELPLIAAMERAYNKYGKWEMSGRRSGNRPGTGYFGEEKERET
ncbi:MAG: phosphoglycerate kinase [Spirochaetes bacterium]|nr:phosphoglycerate kinase [Spirochaetota bacterium]